MFNLKLQNIHFTSNVIKMVPGYMAFQGHLWVMQMRMPTDTLEIYPQSSTEVAAGSFCKAACREPATQLHWIFCLQIWPVLLLLNWAETLDGNSESALCSVVKTLQRFMYSCLSAIQQGRGFRDRACYSDYLLHSQVMRPAGSWHVVVIQSEKTLAKMQLLKNLVGGFLPLLVLKKSKE